MESNRLLGFGFMEYIRSSKPTPELWGRITLSTICSGNDGFPLYSAGACAFPGS